MRELLVSAVPALSLWLALNVAASLAVAACAERIVGLGDSPRQRAWYCLSARLLPSVLSTAFVVLVFVPSWMQFEPAGSDEQLGVTVMVGAVLAFGVVVHATWRGLRAWNNARVQEASWQPLTSDTEVAGLRMLAVESAKPAMTLAGLRSQRLYVSTTVIAALTPEELRVAVRHEAGHGASRDNLKRLAMIAVPDMLSCFPAARRLEDAWAVSAELVADATATGDSDEARLALASAIVKVARLAVNAPAAMSPLVGDGEIAIRVRRLLGGGNGVETERGVRRVAVAATAAAVGLATAYLPMLTAVHRLTETLVRLP